MNNERLDDLEKTAIITDIQRFSVHDGPGIRTLVFFKGCPLRCIWCQNPETYVSSPQLMVTQSVCIGCGACINVCKYGAIFTDSTGNMMTNHTLCRTCGDCVNVCYAEARKISGKSMKVGDVYNEIMRDIIFYRNSGGGVTLSGGGSINLCSFC